MSWKKLADFPAQKVIGAYGRELWALRDARVWHQGRKLAAADAASFEVVEHQQFIARDACSVFHAWSRLPRIDRNSFRQVGMYWLDRSSVYFEYETSLRPLADSDPLTFRELGGGYGADAQAAWYCGRRMKNCTRGRHLQVIPSNDLYASDGEHIYCDGKPLRGANPSRWRILNAEFSGDDEAIYFLERKLPRADPPSWRHIHGAWSKDSKHVFHMNLIEKNAAPDSFEKTCASSLSR
ncbi:DKNYY domain-containing protein [Comamonas guangdongensis]|uniref:DKNYY domain-containing protein n=1 Tax=Comamonas guangdongensis TaxID=510515 RepID=A0ABV3ZYD4_9BURK